MSKRLIPAPRGPAGSLGCCDCGVGSVITGPDSDLGHTQDPRPEARIYESLWVKKEREREREFERVGNQPPGGGNFWRWDSAERAKGSAALWIPEGKRRREVRLGRGNQSMIISEHKELDNLLPRDLSFSTEARRGPRVPR